MVVSTGFIDGMGYIGTVLIGVIVPFLVELGKKSNTSDEKEKELKNFEG